MALNNEIYVFNSKKLQNLDNNRVLPLVLLKKFYTIFIFYQTSKIQNNDQSTWINLVSCSRNDSFTSVPTEFIQN